MFLSLFVGDYNDDAHNRYWFSDDIEMEFFITSDNSGTSPAPNMICNVYHGPTPPAALLSIPCIQDMEGQYVRVALKAVYNLALCEIQVVTG